MLCGKFLDNKLLYGSLLWHNFVNIPNSFKKLFMKKITELQLGFSDAENYRRRENKALFNKVFIRNRYLDKLCEPAISFLVSFSVSFAVLPTTLESRHLLPHP